MKYYKIKYKFIMIYKKKWNKGFFIKKNFILLKDGSTSINYSQQCFEGIKCFLYKKRVIKYNIDKNIIRFQKSMSTIKIPIINFFFFLKILNYLIFLNKKYIPNYKIGFLYLRPLAIGIGNNLGVKNSKQFIFIIYCSPIFYKKNKKNFLFSLIKYRTINEFGNLKIGANYIVNLINENRFKSIGFSDIIYVNKNVFEEVGTSNLIIMKKKIIQSYCNKNILFGINRYYFLKIFKYIYIFNNNSICFNDISNSKIIISIGTAINIKIYKSILYKNKILFYKNNFFTFFYNYIFSLFLRKK